MSRRISGNIRLNGRVQSLGFWLLVGAVLDKLNSCLLASAKFLSAKMGVRYE